MRRGKLPFGRGFSNKMEGLAFLLKKTLERRQSLSL
jgi:hypothetical protein